ncbi:MAG: ATP-binding cassette domain-containing protein [Synergistaceae bacterium]|nr:ATP-binding cassette domain-containing protein [Synergistaceae bacterium]
MMSTPVKFLLSYTRKYYAKILLAVVFMLVSSGLNVLPPYLFKTVVDDVLISKDMFMLNMICIAIVVIFGLKAVTTYYQRYLMNDAGQSAVMDIRIALYDHMQRMSLKKIYASRIGELMSRITGDVATLQNIVTSTFVDLVFNFLTFLGMFGFIIYLNWRLTCIIVLVLPVVGFMLSFASKKLRKAGHNVQEHLADITATAQEAFSAIRVVRSFATEDMELERFTKANYENFKALMQAVSIQGILAGVIEVFLIGALAVVFWIGGQNVIDGAVTPGELISFVGYIAFMVQPIRSVMNQMSVLQTGIASAERVHEILMTPVEDSGGGGRAAVSGASCLCVDEAGEASESEHSSKDSGRVSENVHPCNDSASVSESEHSRNGSANASESEHPREDSGSISESEHSSNDSASVSENVHPRVDTGRISGAVRFENVHFSYDSQEVLKGIDLDVKAGEKIAIVGATGSGKSTIADLIPRFYDPTEGRILIDGKDIRTFSLRSLRTQIGIVPQECVLMKGSIAFNIAYGLENIDMQRVIDAAEIADIRSFIESLPDKYDSEVGERGVTLSGGQRQRIAIARAVIRDPRILILDEATSSLDIAVERAVQKAINQAMTGRTSFIIAHRLTTIREADRIFVLEGGKFTQSGTHEELLRSGGLYADLYRMQFGQD